MFTLLFVVAGQLLSMPDSLQYHGMHHRTPLSFTISRSSLKFLSVESVLLSNHLILCRSCFSFCFNLSHQQVFSSELALCTRWPKYWSFNFSISPSNEYSGLVPFRIDWLYLLEVQGTLESLLQYYNLKASVLRRSSFLMVELSNSYMTTGKIIALTLQTFCQ